MSIQHVSEHVALEHVDCEEMELTAISFFMHQVTFLVNSVCSACVWMPVWGVQAHIALQPLAYLLLDQSRCLCHGPAGVSVSLHLPVSMSHNRFRI